eukprot:6481336-Amphidinium_carterae.1
MDKFNLTILEATPYRLTPYHPESSRHFEKQGQGVGSAVPTCASATGSKPRSYFPVARIVARKTIALG